MSESLSCPKCGAELPSSGLCAACAANFLQGEPTVAPGEPFVPPTVAELAEKFPQLEIFELIGKGGMGAVYRARQRELDRIVALKILPPGIGDNPAFAERFAREARALAKLSHPNIVTLFEFGRAGDGPYFFLMEFVDGVNLRQLLLAERVSPREALEIVPQICDALQFAHDHGIVHRDIKPENILLDRRGRVKVADFGLAKLIGSGAEVASEGIDASADLTGAGKILGTPSYMAPEQTARPDAVDHRADIYALGVVFYQMLTGELPKKQIEPPSRKVQIDVRLDEVVLRALEKNPDRRYAAASLMKTRVEEISAGGAVEPERSAIVAAIENWLVHMDRGDYAQSWATAAPYFQRAVTQEEWIERGEKIRRPLGALLSRKYCSGKFAAAGMRFEAKFSASFDGLPAARETVTYARQPNGEWLAIGYLIRPAGYAFKRLLKKFFFIQLPIGIALLLLIRTFFLEPFVIPTDAAAPELPRGSRFLVWKLARDFTPGDLIAYRHENQIWAGRIVRNEDGAFRVNRNGEPDAAIPRADVLGKITVIYWRGNGAKSVSPGSQSTNAIPAVGVFGPVIDRVVDKDGMIDFDTGRIVAELPESVTKANDLAENVLDAFAWMEREGMDAMSMQGGLLSEDGFKGLDLKIKPLDLAAWDQLTPEQLQAILAATAVEKWQSLLPDKKIPATCAFQTREGGRGVLQITGFAENPTSVKLRYKLVQNGSDSSSARQSLEEEAVKKVAQRLLAAIRDQDDAALKATACDLIAGWRDALPAFAKELRRDVETFTGNTDALNRIEDVLVDGDFAAVKAASVEKVDGCLVLFFSKTADGWRNFALRNAAIHVSLKDLLATNVKALDEPLRKRALALVDLLVKQKFAEVRAEFDETMRAALPEAKLEELWQQLNSAGGKFLGMDSTTRMAKVGEFLCVYVPCRWTRNKVDLKVVFDASGKVSGLWIVAPGSR